MDVFWVVQKGKNGGRGEEVEVGSLKHLILLVLKC